MKNFIFTLLISISFLNASAQCNYTFPCATPIHDSCLSNASFNGDQCFQGPMIVANSNNLNNWMSLVFKNHITMQQTLNMPAGASIYSDGWNSFTSVNFTGNDRMYISGQQTIITALTSNNSNPGSLNIIYLVNGATFFYGTTQYYVGQYIQLPGNSSNRIYIEACSNIALPITIQNFQLKNGRLEWRVNLQQNEGVELEYASNSDSTHFQTVKFSNLSQDSYSAELGFYRLRVTMKVSNIINVTSKNLNLLSSTPGEMRDVYTGEIITKPQSYRPYIQDHKIKELVQ
jgi:hypothetical protein